MKHSRVGNLILDYDDQTKLAILASELLGSTDKNLSAIAVEFLDWVGDNLAPDEE